MAVANIEEGAGYKVGEIVELIETVVAVIVALSMYAFKVTPIRDVIVNFFPPRMPSP